MARRAPSRLGALARGLGLLVLTLFAVLAVAIALFPFERLAPALERRIEAETRIQTAIGALDVRLTAHGPELTARDIGLRWPTGEVLALEGLTLSAARPGEWLRGVPTLRVSARAAFGAFDGDVSRATIAGTLARFDFSQLPPSWFGTNGSPLEGPVDADVALERLAQQWSGRIELKGRTGSLALPGAPLAIPYETLAGDLTLDEVGTLHVDSLVVEGPMVSASARGEVAAGYAGPATGAVAIEISIARMDPALAPALAPYGAALDASGAGTLHVSGTPDAVVIR